MAKVIHKLYSQRIIAGKDERRWFTVCNTTKQINNLILPNYTRDNDKVNCKRCLRTALIHVKK